MNTIKITIKGPAGSGKTTLATMITRSFKALGMNVELDDPDKALTTENNWLVTHDSRVSFIKANTKIQIRTKTTR